VRFFTPHGTVKRAWTPSGSENDFTLSPILKPLERHKTKLVVLSGISMQDVGVGAPHTKGLPLVWTGSRLLDDGTFTRSDGSGGPTYGWNSSASVDQIVASAIGKQTPYRSLEFGVRSGGSNPASRMIYTDSEMFAKLLDQLDAVPEGNGSLLDNTMVVWGSELGTGNTHSFKSTPFVVAGGGGGAYATGRFLEYADKLDHNRLLVSIWRQGQTRGHLPGCLRCRSGGGFRPARA
jgi:hypothetical protein